MNDSRRGIGRREASETKLRPISLAEVNEVDQETVGKDFWMAVVLSVGLSGLIIVCLSFLWRS